MSASMLARVDASGRPLYKLTSGGNVVRTRKVPKYRRLRVLARDGHACVLCGSTDDLEVDHVVRYADGGDNSEANLRTLCKACHGARGGRS